MTDTRSEFHDNQLHEVPLHSIPSGFFRDLVGVMSDFIGTVDEEGNIAFINPAGRALLEIPLDEDLTGHSIFPYQEPTFLAGTFREKNPHATWTGAAVFISRTGRRIPMSQMVVTHYIDGRTYVSTIAREITQQVAVEAELRHRADHDPLTNLLNRNAFKEVVESHRHQPMVLALFDLDRFKAVNDTYGHHAGDEVLLGTARILERTIEGIGCVSRLGGDEFALVIFNETVASSATLMNHLVTQMRAFLIRYDVGASVGLADLSPDTPLDKAMRLADAALYEQKGHTQPRAQSVHRSGDPSIVASDRRRTYEIDLTAHN